MKRRGRIVMVRNRVPESSEEIKVGAAVYLKRARAPAGRVIAIARGGNLVVRWPCGTAANITTVKPSDLLLAENPDESEGEEETI